MEDKSSRVICQPHEEKVGGWKTQEGGREAGVRSYRCTATWNKMAEDNREP